MTKSELKEMIRECLKEELSRVNLEEAVATDEPVKDLKEDAVSGTMNWEELLAKADHLLDDLTKASGNTDPDDGDGYWQEEYTTWCNRKLYYARLNDTVSLEKLCDEYSKKLPNVEFYFYDDEDADEDEEVSEIGYTATKTEYEKDEWYTEELENIFEGIFDSKADKQKKYSQIIADNFDKKAPAAIAFEIAISAESAISETVDRVDDDNVSTATIAAKNFISSINGAKANAKKTPYGLLTSIISYVQKYNRDAMGLDELVEFKRTAQYVQSHEKDGQKAMYYLMELVNKQIETRIDRTINFLKNEYSIH